MCCFLGGWWRLVEQGTTVPCYQPCFHIMLTMCMYYYGEKLLFFNYQEVRNHKRSPPITWANSKPKLHHWFSELGFYMGEVCGREDRALSLVDANLWWCELCVQVAFNWPANFCNIGNDCNFCFCIWSQKRKWPQLPIEFMEMRSQVS